MFQHTGQLKCKWVCSCGHKNECPTKMSDYLEQEDEHDLLRTKRNNMAYFCGRCHKMFNPYLETGIIRPEYEGEIFNKPFQLRIRGNNYDVQP